LRKQLVTGNQAVALGALRAGVRVAMGYPGTPSTGCIEHLLTMDLPGRHVEWSTNEKVAFEIAAGAAWAGHRALCTMKMSGVNVAYDAVISIAYSGTNGGLVVYVADDPGVGAGMAEQDSRGFASMSNLPMLEPSTPAEAYSFVQTAFALSEAVGTPVFLRLTTAVALSHSVVETDDPVPLREIEPILDKDIARYTKAGSTVCRQQHRDLIARLERAGEWVHKKELNRLELAGEPGGLGIVACGAVNAYLPEACELAQNTSEDRSSPSMSDDVSILHVVTTVPFPREEAKRLLEHCGTILVLEELEPHVERELYVLAHRQDFEGAILGKLDGTLPRIGEFGAAEILTGIDACSLLSGARGDSEILRATGDEPQPTEERSAPRPITVCAGCPHRGTYLAIEAAIERAGFKKDEVMVTGDIGCTILGMNPPFDLLWNEVSMGSSVGIAQGYVHAGIETPVIATIGDSTFFHGGIPGLINAIQYRTPVTLVVMDNGWTAMTGMQVNPGTDTVFQKGGRCIDLERVIRGLGPDHILVVDPYDLEATTEVLADCLKDPFGVHVVLAQRECAIQAMRRGLRHGTTTVDPETCTLCKKCLRVTGCPALSVGERSMVINPHLCNGCGLCTTVCPTAALDWRAAE